MWNVLESGQFKTDYKSCLHTDKLSHEQRVVVIGRASLARENEAGGSWGQEVHILHVNI